MSNPDLEHEIKELIISTLDLEDIKPENIDSRTPLFVEGLGLDSIDALELGLALQKKYDIKISKDSEENKKYFASVANLAELIQSGGRG